MMIYLIYLTPWHYRDMKPIDFGAWRKAHTLMPVQLLTSCTHAQYDLLTCIPQGGCHIDWWRRWLCLDQHFCFLITANRKTIKSMFMVGSSCVVHCFFYVASVCMVVCRLALPLEQLTLCFHQSRLQHW